MSPGNWSGISDQTVLVALLSLRLINVLTSQTFFQPDEYYQALEPAWNLAFNDGYAWMTWEWKQNLRSALHPALISLAYHGASRVIPWIDDPDARDNVVLLAPKLLQHTIAALGDFYTWKLSYKVYGSSRQAFVTLCLTTLSPWQWFCSTRTFSNGLENTLTVAAMYYWPFDWTNIYPSSKPNIAQSSSNVRVSTKQSSNGKIWQLRTALTLAAFATIMRPTNILIWLSLATLAVLGPQQTSSMAVKESKQKHDRQSTNLSSITLTIAREGTTFGLLALGVSILVDRWFYHSWTFPPLNFLYFNVIQSLAVFYGNNDWHYYISQGYPLLLTTALPFALIGLWRIFSNSSTVTKLPVASRSALRGLGIVSIALPAALSVLSHKEVRFIYPIIGPLHVIATGPITEFFSPVFNTTRDTIHQTSLPKFARGLLLMLLITLNTTIAGYTTLIHNAGLIALPEYLRNEFTSHYTPTNPGTNLNMTIGILMPCHSIPWRSHLLHPPSSSTPGIQAWALTCEPPLHLTNPAEKSKYLDEADVFYADPTSWLRRTMTRQPPWTFAQRPNQTRPEPPSRPPGLYTDPSSRNNKRLWDASTGANPAHAHNETRGIDITDLLPQLRTAPGHGPASGEDATVGRRPWPHYLAFFAQLEPTLTNTLRGSGYVECWRRFNSHRHDDWRRTGDVVVWCLFPERAGEHKDRNMVGGGKGGDGSDSISSLGRKGAQTESKLDAGSVAGRPGKQKVIRPGD